MDEALKWVEEHPAISAVIGVGGAIVLLYLFGVFGSSSSNAQTGQSNLAAAYYAAEQAQTVAGTQLNMVQANDQAATAQAQIQANAATSIAATQAGMYTTLGNQTLQGNQTLYNDEMLTSNTAANDAVQTAANTNYYQYMTANAANTANVWTTAMNTVMPIEMAQSGGNQIFNLGQYGTSNIYDSPIPSINALMAQGYTQAQANAIAATSSGIPGLA